MALQPHPIDSAIGDEKRPVDEILKDLAKSESFCAVVTKAVEESSELEPGIMGASFAQQVRVSIGRNLLNK